MIALLSSFTSSWLSGTLGIFATCTPLSDLLEPIHSLELIVWLVPSLISYAISVSFLGLVLGPLYPIVISHAGTILPHSLFAGAVGWMAGCGQAGSAFVPLIAGAIASERGIWTLQPL